MTYNYNKMSLMCLIFLSTAPVFEHFKTPPFFILLYIIPIQAPSSLSYQMTQLATGRVISFVPETRYSAAKELITNLVSCALYPHFPYHAILP